ncbi:methyltransferase domain-containing protein [Patescibacteria group bacterium]|nr:methyltransferase domain-containing protein [Patescibacteria group bacterium]
MDYVCLKCQRKLVDRDNDWYCEYCQISWPKIHGLDCFFDRDDYWGEISRDEMKQLLASIERDGWQKANRELAQKDPQRLKFIYNPGRADWRFYVPLDNQSVVLDAGCGLGAITLPLAEVVKEVVAFDTSCERARFVQLRAAKENKTNIQVLVASLFNPPFKKQSFDLIVMNGLLEWVGAGKIDGNPGEIQIEALKKMKELLKPGGCLYIGIENRFGLPLLTGRGLDHSGLRFTSIMPRFLARIYAKIRRKSDYRTYTYTRRGYEKLLNDAGFENIDFFLPWPGYNDTRIIVPHRNLNALRYLVLNIMSSNSFVKKIVKIAIRIPFVLRLYRFLFFSFGIVANKNKQ